MKTIVWIDKLLFTKKPKPITYPVLECRERWLEKLLEEGKEHGVNEPMAEILP